MGRPLVFALNGERVEVPQPDPSMTLLSYIRTFTPLRGTKLGCGEGGCGACLVLLARYDAGSMRVEESTINSCLAPLCSLDLCAVTTTEGLGNSRDGLHAVHKRLAGFHGSQCGFCTPGMSMALYGSLRQAQAQAAGEGKAQNGGAGCGLTASKAEIAIQGNICRCTGYRPILDTCKSFAEDVDVEDLGLNSYWSEKEKASTSLLPAYDPAKDPAFPKFLVEISEAERSQGALSDSAKWSGTQFLDGGLEERLWVPARSLGDLFAALDKYQRQREVKLVVGNTSQGIYKDIKPQVFVDISTIPELLVLQRSKTGLEVGSAVTIAKFIAFLEDAASTVYTQLAAHLHRLASGHVRNRASVGGNLIMAQQLGFDSDMATVLLGAGASLRIASNHGETVLSLEDFLARGSLDPGSVLVSVIVPSWDLEATSNGTANGIGHANGHANGHADGHANGHANGNAEAASHDELLFKTYRASPRPLGNSVSYVNAAFLARIEQVEGKYLVKQVRLAFGAFGTKHAVLAVEVQDFMVGKEVTAQILLEAVALLKSTIVPAKGTHKAAYRSSVVVAYFFDFFRPFLGLTDGFELDAKVRLDNGDHSSSVNGVTPENGTGTRRKGTKAKLLSKGTQAFAVSDEFYPVGDAAPKVVAELQASGEAVYVDDIPSPEGCLYAAFICSEHALAEVKGIDGSLALASPGAVSVVTAADIPKGGLNQGMNVMGITEPLFATDKVEFHGHPLGLVVADSYEHARDAAGKVEVTYDKEKLGPPTLTIEDAVARNSYFEVARLPGLAPVGDAEKALSESELKIENAEVFAGSQYHFYMETQTALAIPDEDGQIMVYSASQGTENVQQSISECLGIPMNNVRVITRRLGGGFGGKCTKSCIVATACALAAWKLRRPVRMYLDRKTDMLIVGGRHPTRANYSVGFTKEGKITALQAKVIMDAGWSAEFSPYLTLGVHASFKKYNWGAFAAEYKVVKTNLSSKTAVRGPGDVQGSFFAESVIEHVAATLGLAPQEVRDRNMHSVDTASVFWDRDTAGGAEGFTLPIIWEKLKAKSNFHERQKEVEKFNSESKWVKLGLAMVPVIYLVKIFGKHGRVTAFADGSVVVEVGGIEMGQGLWTKVRQTAAYGLSRLWDEPGTGRVDISKIRIVQSDSISFGNGGITGGSTTSEGNCAAVNEACKVLVERLTPIKHKLEAASPDGVSWEAVVATAKMTGVDLSAQTMWTPGAGESSYLNVGAAVSEVEVDVRTGETVVLQTDLLYDCGKSLNPAVDIGQIEGSFVQGLGFFLSEEILTDEDGHQISEGTWLYKPPTLDNIPRVFNVELLNSAAHKVRILSSKAVGEPPLLLASSVHCAVRQAISSARRDISGGSTDFFRLDSPASIDKVKTHCGLGNVEQLLAKLVSQKNVTG